MVVSSVGTEVGALVGCGDTGQLCPREKMWLVHAEGAISKNSAAVTCKDDRIGGLGRINVLSLLTAAGRVRLDLHFDWSCRVGLDLDTAIRSTLLALHSTVLRHLVHGLS
jgi:hypothetical protein